MQDAETRETVRGHHRRLGVDDPKWMITFAWPVMPRSLERSFLRRWWPKLLISLWREQHPKAHEQKPLELQADQPLPYQSRYSQKRIEEQKRSYRY